MLKRLRDRLPTASASSSNTSIAYTQAHGHLSAQQDIRLNEVRGVFSPNTGEILTVMFFRIERKVYTLPTLISKLGRILASC